MDIQAHLRYLHMSPRKVRRVANTLKGMLALRAQAELDVRNERAAEPLRKLLKSALANARSVTNASPELAVLSSIRVDEGPKTKRYRPRSRGTAHQILRRMSHITMILSIPEGAKTARREVSPAPQIEAKATKQEPEPSLRSEGARSAPLKKDSRRSSRRFLRPRLPKISKRIFQRKSV